MRLSDREAQKVTKNCTQNCAEGCWCWGGGGGSSTLNLGGGGGGGGGGVFGISFFFNAGTLQPSFVCQIFSLNIFHLI